MSTLADTLPRRVDAKALIPTPLAVFIVVFCGVTPITGNSIYWAIALGGAAIAVVRNGELLRKVWVPLPLLAYLIWMTMSYFWSVMPGKTLRELFTQYSFVLLGALIAAGRDKLDLLALLVKTTGPFIAANLLFAVLVPAIGQTDERAYLGSVKGLFIDKNTFGFYCVVVFVSALAYARAAARRDKPWAYGAAVFSAIGIVTSNSRTALLIMIAAALLTLLIGLLGRTRRPLFLPVLGWGLVLAVGAWLVSQIAGLIFAAVGRNADLTGRTRIWWIVQQAIAERPIQGFGWKALWVDGDPTSIRFWSLYYNTPFYHAHNGYLDLAAQLGIVGAVLGWGFVLYVLGRSVRDFHYSGRPLDQWPIVLVITVLIYNATEVMGLVNTTWIMLVALACCVPVKKEEIACISATHGD